MRFVPDEPALFLEPDVLVVADLHIGLERELAAKGITVPDQLMKLQERLFSLIDKTNAKRLVIIGDIKNEYAGTNWQELRDVPAFFSRLSGKVKIVVVKGNHDGGLESMVPKSVEVREPEGFVLEDVLFTHGQAWPDKGALGAKTLVMGHVHPAVEFWSAGARSVEPVWIRAPVNRGEIERKFGCATALETAIIAPAFNRLSGATAFNSLDFRPGTLFSKMVDWENGEVFLLDGTFLGKLKSLPKEKRLK